MPNPFNTYACKGIVYTGVAGSLLSVTSLLSQYHLLFDLLSHFRVQYIVLISISLCLSLLSRTHTATLLLIGCLAIHSYSVGSSMYGKYAPDSNNDGPVVRMMTSNLFEANTQYSDHIAYLRETNPDIIVFQEYTHSWDKALSSALPEYIHTTKIPLHNAFGIALYSKFPLTDTRHLDLVRPGIPTIASTVLVEDQTLMVIGAHPPPTVSSRTNIERNTILQKLATLAHSSNLPVLILGDLNITPWSYHFNQLLDNGELHSSRKGFGIFPTWPASSTFLQLPIDHILHSKGIQTRKVGTSSGLFSDHKSFWADIQIPR